MKRSITLALLALSVSMFIASVAAAKKEPPRVGGGSAKGIFQEMPYASDVFQGTTLHEWHFEAGATPSKQGWTEHDITSQDATYFHVDGFGNAPCNEWNAAPPINGAKSMWCGQWPTTSAPWCGWITTPGYGNNWDQSLVSTIDASSVEYAIMWDSEPGYDFTTVEWFDASNNVWVADPTVNGGAGTYTGIGGPQTETSTAASAGVIGPTKVRFHFRSDGTWSDQDGLWDTSGGVIVDDLRLDGGAPENFESTECLANTSANGKWSAAITPPFGLYAGLTSGAGVVQEGCTKNTSFIWEFFDSPLITNYACGGWPSQGAMPYGPNSSGLYMDNEIWSPWLPVPNWDQAGSINLRFRTYRDLPLDYLQFYTWRIRSKGPGFCTGDWRGPDVAYYSGHKDWVTSDFAILPFIPAQADSFQIALCAFDMVREWAGRYGSGACHSHGPLFDDVMITEPYKALWYVRHVDLFQDNFSEESDNPIEGKARADMAMDILPNSSPGILPGDSVVVRVSDTWPVIVDPGTTAPAIYLFVKVTDRFGNPVPGKSGLALQSPDELRSAGNFCPWGPRFKCLDAGSAPPNLPADWSQYQMDYVYTLNGMLVPDIYCGDLMDLAAGPYDRHENEDKSANTGIFTPGDVVWYFFGFHTSHPYRPWSFLYRGHRGQGGDFVSKNDCLPAAQNPFEFSILPDAGRLTGDDGDILFVDDADDRLGASGEPPQIYFDAAFHLLGLDDRVDRFDVLGPSSAAGNSLASRVKSVYTQLIGSGPLSGEIYQKVLWNSDDLSIGLMGDGSVPNGGSSAEKSDDFALCYAFLNNHPDNPGWAYWGDDVVSDWNTLTGAGAIGVKSAFMNHTCISGDQSKIAGVTSPVAYPVNPLPPPPYLRPAESFYALGGCPMINDFDVPGQAGNSSVAHKYKSASSGPNASLSQVTQNSQGTNARFFLAGFGFDVIRDDETDGLPDYADHLWEIIRWFQNELPDPVGINPMVLENRLDNNHPNPFNPTTRISYSIAEPGYVSLRIYNAAGQLVRTLVDEDKVPTAGGFTIEWNGRSDRGQPVASGVYFYRLEAKNFSQTKKMVVLK